MSRNFFMSFLLNFIFLTVLSLLNNASDAWCFFSSICYTSKLKSWIQISQQLIKTLKTSAALLFSCVTNVCAFSSMTKNTSYKYAWTFFSALSSSQHSCFSVLYEDSVSDHVLLSYLQICWCCWFFVTCIKQKSQLFKLESTVSMILSASSLYTRDCIID